MMHPSPLCSLSLSFLEEACQDQALRQLARRGENPAASSFYPTTETCTCANNLLISWAIDSFYMSCNRWIRLCTTQSQLVSVTSFISHNNAMQEEFVVAPFSVHQFVSSLSEIINVNQRPLWEYIYTGRTYQYRDWSSFEEMSRAQKEGDTSCQHIMLLSAPFRAKFFFLVSEK